MIGGLGAGVPQAPANRFQIVLSECSRVVSALKHRAHAVQKGDVVHVCQRDILRRLLHARADGEVHVVGKHPDLPQQVPLLARRGEDCPPRPSQSLLIDLMPAMSGAGGGVDQKTLRDQDLADESCLHRPKGGGGRRGAAVGASRRITPPPPQGRWWAARGGRPVATPKTLRGWWHPQAGAPQGRRLGGAGEAGTFG